MPPSDDSLTRRLINLAEEVEREGAKYKEATTHRTRESKITLAVVELIEAA